MANKISLFPPLNMDANPSPRITAPKSVYNLAEKLKHTDRGYMAVFVCLSVGLSICYCTPGRVSTAMGDCLWAGKP